MLFNQTQKCICQNENNFFRKIVALSGPIAPSERGVLGYGSLRSLILESVVGPTPTPVSFDEVGPLSKNITVSSSGNELVVHESGIYQITISINSEASAAPDPTQPFFTVFITINGVPIYDGTGEAIFDVANRSSSAYIIQTPLNPGDVVGVSAAGNPISGYGSRALTIVQLA
ncbi:hypothetical protein [Lysinibacillus fusiformis]|uniref:hypothetical protein n=1 Tax=Lysinibacillus fusiformis TaxID=28031 RepID=UPI003815E105